MYYLLKKKSILLNYKSISILLLFPMTFLNYGQVYAWLSCWSAFEDLKFDEHRTKAELNNSCWKKNVCVLFLKKLRLGF